MYGRKAGVEEELVQGKFGPMQTQGPEEEEELLQGKFAANEAPTQFQANEDQAQNRTGMPDPLKTGLEQLSDMDLSGVRVHKNSSKPAQLNALAYTQGQDIHVAPGQEKHLPHEGWHAVQQMQGRVKPTMQAKGVSINDDKELEREADVMGTKALQAKGAEQATRGSAKQGPVLLQREVMTKGGSEVSGKSIGTSGEKVRLNLSTRGGVGHEDDPYERHADTVATAAQPVVQRRKCTSKDNPDKIITAHAVLPTTIQAPGDTVTITVDFACDIRDGESHIETAGGTSLGLRKFLTKSNQYKRTWDGKKLFTEGTYLADDGDYRHRLDKVTYAYKYNPTTKISENVYVTGAKLISPAIKIAARPYAGTGKVHHHYSAQNVTDLAAIIISEMQVGNAAEQEAVAWAVRNQMIRMSTSSVAKARDHFKDAHGTAGTAAAKTTAETILKKPMADDTTSGAIKWFSPRSMPAAGDSCKGYDCGGGLITVTNNAGVKVKHYAPSWHATMTYKVVAGTREWYVRFYTL